ncbi:MAG: uroporphyrinogen decarboxylase family protein [Bacillota bacterium]|nr:uroporphyrinogen decarboxylase family protein [Bacillota bacterium]
MKQRERVKKAINGEAIDRVPKGELLVDREFIEEYLEKVLQYDCREAVLANGQLELAAWEQVLRDLDIDLISIMPSLKLNEVSLAEIDQLAVAKLDTEVVSAWSKKTDYFVFGVVNGGFQHATFYFDFMEILAMTRSKQQELSKVFGKFAALNTEVALELIKAGADGIIIGDDVAFNQGTYFAPDIMREILFPHTREMVRQIKAAGVPVFFHADGNINQILPDIVEMGFDGVHSLQPTAGMNIKAIKEKYGHQLCLMGNMDLDVLIPLGTLEEIAAGVQETLSAAKPGGRYIFGTCGAISKGLPLEKVRHLYQTAAKYGNY